MCDQGLSSFLASEKERHHSATIPSSRTTRFLNSFEHNLFNMGNEGSKQKKEVKRDFGVDKYTVL